MATMTYTDIANLALSHAKSKTIQDLDKDNSTSAILARQFFSAARLASLEAYDWSFARRFRVLASSAEEPEDNWLYAYVLPADCVAPRWVVDPTDSTNNSVPYVVAASDSGRESILLTNQPSAKLRYTFDQINPHMYTPNFVISLSHRLAAYIAFAETGKASIRDAQIVLAEAAEKRARGADANTNRRDKKAPDVDWIKERTR